MKISCVYSKFLQKAETLYNDLLKQHSFSPIEDADVILCLGGDGFMLHCLHNFLNLNKTLYGINCGSYGFLLNEFTNDFNINSLSQATKFDINPLVAYFEDNKGNTSEAFAFNEISLIRGKPTSSHLKINIDEITRMDKLVGDGVLVATPIGSTAYNRACGGNIVSIDSNLLVMTPINPFSPLSWKGTTFNNSHKIEILNLSPGSRPINLSADFQEFPNIINVKIALCKTNKITLLFDKINDLENKIIKSQFSQQ